MYSSSEAPCAVSTLTDASLTLTLTNTNTHKHNGVPPNQSQELVYGSSEAPCAVSTLSDPSKPVLFSMARLDRVKNLTGVVEW